MLHLNGQSLAEDGNRQQMRSCLQTTRHMDTCNKAYRDEMKDIGSDEPAGDYGQLLKYAEDLAKVHQEEKAKSEALRRANARLKKEIGARHEAESGVRKAYGQLEKMVELRTRELVETNKRLEGEIAQRISAEEQIRGQLREKDVLLSEIHHRVKNNLQVICSLLALQRSNIDNEIVLGALNDCWSRVRSMALIHEQLYRSKDLSRIDLREYVQALTRVLIQACSDKVAPVTVTTNLDEAHVSVDSALPCGLIINELVTNCLKHAFPEGRAGEVRVEFKRNQDGGYSLTVADDGEGLPEDLDYRRPGSLGLDLVFRLAEFQLGGKVHVSTGSGTTIRIEMPDLK